MKKEEKMKIFKKDTRVSYIITQLKNRIKGYPVNSRVCIDSSRLKLNNEIHEKIGPGSYKVKYANEVESHGFSSLPRLFTPISHNKNIMHVFMQVNKSRCNYPKNS